MIANENGREPEFLMIINGLTEEAYKRPDGVMLHQLVYLKIS